MGTDPPPQSKKEQRRSSRQIRWDATVSCKSPNPFLTHPLLSIPFTGVTSSPGLPWLSLRKLSEAQGRDKGLVIP